MGNATSEQDNISVTPPTREEYLETLVPTKPIINIVLFGLSGAGKSTIYANWHLLEKEEKENSLFISSYTRVIYYNILQMTKNILEKIPEEEKTHDYKMIQELKFDINNSTQIYSNYFTVIENIWKKEIILQTYYNLKQSHDEQFLENSNYFFVENDLQKLRPPYIPSEEILYCYYPTIHTNSFKKDFGEYIMTVKDPGGAKSQRMYWKEIQDVHTIVYVVSLSHFDTKICDEDGIAFFDQSLSTFEKIVNDPTYDNVPIILVLNKSDLLIEKLKYFKFSDSVKDFEGENNFRPIIEFVKRKYLSKCKTRLAMRHKIHIIESEMIFKSSFLHFMKIIKKVITSENVQQAGSIITQNRFE